MRRIAVVCLAGALAAGACAGNDAGAPTSSPASSPSLPPGVRAAPAGRANVPRAGEYVYAFSGRATTPDASPRSAPPNARRTFTVTHAAGGVVAVEQRSSIGPAVFRERAKWSPGRIERIGFDNQAGGASNSCTFDPPILVMHLPIRAEHIPGQELSGTGNGCTGEVTIEVVSQARVTDASGLSWRTWRIEEKTTSAAGGTTVVATQTRWFSPDLGIDVKIEGVQDSRNQSGPLAHSRATSVLESYPAEA